MRTAAALSLVTLFACGRVDRPPPPTLAPAAFAQTVKRVTVSTRAPPVNWLLMVDTSASMGFSAERRPECDGCANSACGENGCLTALGEVRGALDTFLEHQGALIDQGWFVHLGLSAFPDATAGQCAVISTQDIGTRGVGVDLDGPNDVATLSAKAAEIRSKVDALTPGGSSPTALALGSLADFAPLQRNARDEYAVLMTNGRPSCNPANDQVATTCQCTFEKGASDQACMAGSPAANACLDRDGAVGQVAALRAKGIATLVFAAGSQRADQAANDTVEALARAGA